MTDDLTLHFTAQQNPLPKLLLAAGVELPVAYEGTSEDEHLSGLYADLVRLHGVSLAAFPASVMAGEKLAADPDFTNFVMQAARARDLLATVGKAFTPFTNPESVWWDFQRYLPLSGHPASAAAGNYLLHVAAVFGADFDGMVLALQVIFELENMFEREQLVPISALQRFARLYSEAWGEDGWIFTIPNAWQAAKVWEYAEVRKLLASDFDTEYGLRLAAIGFDSFEEVQQYAATMPKHWIESLTEGLFPEADAAEE